MLRILRSWNQVEEARKSLQKRGFDASRGWRRSLFVSLYALRYRFMPPPVAINKSWDVQMMLDCILQNHPDRKTLIYDMGSFNSEIPLALWNAGYRRILAADMDPRGRSINWYGNWIRFRRENFYRSDLEPSSLDVVTTLSTIEHGYDQEKLLSTAQRLLKRGGALYITTDYHEDKIDIPGDYTLFGLSYQIFSRKDVQSLLEDAGAWGFEPAGDILWEPSEYPIEWLGRRIAFIFVGLRKVREIRASDQNSALASRPIGAVP